MKYTECKTKQEKVNFIREMLIKSDAWLKKGVVTIYERQTASEQNDRTTLEDNGVGFSGADAEFLTAMALAVKTDRHFTDKMLSATRKAMVKYAGQLRKIADGEI